MIVRLSGGLGNQFFQYAFGRAISLKRQERLTLDNFAFSRDEQREYVLDNFNIEADVISDFKKTIYNTAFFLNRRIHKQLSGKTYGGIYYESSEFAYDNVETLNTEYFHGCWQNERYFTDICSMLREELTYRKPLSREKQKVLDYIVNNIFVAVHVRHGDYLKPVNQQMYNILDADYYLQAMEYIKRRDKNCRFCFFSDDIEWCKEQFGNREDCFFFAEIEDNSAAEDIFFMQNCKHFIIANSSFSWWASALGRNEVSICIAPYVWYKDANLNERAVEGLLKNYIKIDNNNI